MIVCDSQTGRQNERGNGKQPRVVDTCARGLPTRARGVIASKALIRGHCSSAARWCSGRPSVAFIRASGRGWLAASRHHVACRPVTARLAEGSLRASEPAAIWPPDCHVCLPTSRAAFCWPSSMGRPTAMSAYDDASRPAVGPATQKSKARMTGCNGPARNTCG